MIKFGPNDYRMWYTANGHGVGGLALATSTDNLTWTRSKLVVRSNTNDITSFTSVSVAVPRVRQLSNGTWVMFAEARPAGYPWYIFGWTSPDATNWTIMNGGQPVLKGNPSIPWMNQGVANPIFYELPNSAGYVLFFNGHTGTMPDLTTFQFQVGFATATNPQGPYTVDAASPIAGHAGVNFGTETSGFVVDPSGNWVVHVQDYTSADNSTGDIYRIWPVSTRGGTLTDSSPNDAAVTGRLLDPGTFTAESQSVETTERASNGNLYLMGLVDSATLPAPNTSTNLMPIFRAGIRRSTFGSASPGDLSFAYWDASGVAHYWNGSAWVTSTVSAATSNTSREVVASIQDDGTNYLFKVVYADNSSTIASASVAKSSVKSFSNGRFMIAGDPFTNTWSGGQYFRYIGVRSYNAAEPSIALGSISVLAPGSSTPNIADGGFEQVAVGAGQFRYAPLRLGLDLRPAERQQRLGDLGQRQRLHRRQPGGAAGPQVAFLQATGSFSQAVAGWAAGSYAAHLLRRPASQLAGVAAGLQRAGRRRGGGYVHALGHVVPVLLHVRVHGHRRVAHDRVPGPGQRRRRQHRLRRPGRGRRFVTDSHADADAPTVGDMGLEQVAVGAGQFRYAPSGSAWTFAPRTATAARGSRPTAAASPPATRRRRRASQVAFLQATGSFSQAIAGWAAGSYVLTFYAAQRANWQASRQDFSVLVDGVVVGTFTPSGTSYQSYTTAAFTVAAGSHTIAFQGLDSAGGDNTAFVDAVAVAVASSPTPTPTPTPTAGDTERRTRSIYSPNGQYR